MLFRLPSYWRRKRLRFSVFKNLAAIQSDWFQASGSVSYHFFCWNPMRSTLSGILIFPCRSAGYIQLYRLHFEFTCEVVCRGRLSWIICKAEILAVAHLSTSTNGNDAHRACSHDHKLQSISTWFKLCSGIWAGIEHKFTWWRNIVLRTSFTQKEF